MDSVREQPIAQAEVRLHPFGNPSPAHRAFTDGGGRVSFCGVGHGRYYVEVEKEEYELYRDSVDVGASSGLNIHVSLRARQSPVRPAIGGVVSTAMLAPGPARKEYELGMSLLKDKPAESVPHFRKAIDAFPNFPEAFALLGVAYMRAGNFTEALAAAAHAIELRPSNTTARLVRGQLYLAKKEFAKAEADLLESIRNNPDSWFGYNELARCYFLMGSFEHAVQAAQKAHDQPQAPAATHLLLVDIFLGMGRSSAALHDLEEFVREDPQNPLIPKVQARIETLRKQLKH